MKRPTIADIARRAGVTKSAVSFALNGRPGVSQATRARILAIAEELGWQPSSAARALSDGRAGALGLVVDRPARTLGIEPYFTQLISGIEGELAARDVALLLQVTADREAQLGSYRRWWAERRVDGVFLVDLQVDDARIALLKELGMPAIVIGGPQGLAGLPGVWNDEVGTVRSVVEYLAALGHRRIARVAGLPELWHTVTRTEAFEATAGELGVTPITVPTDYTGEQGARATRSLLASVEPPTAIVYDNDVMALAGLSVAAEMGVPVPERLSLVAWDDSVLCQLVHPPLTAVSLDIAAYGARVARLLLDQVTGEAPQSVCHVTPVLVPRGSTAPPRRRMR
ncbi:MAG TPA: LacI family DNA-binding transcriptional regulator [Streptosporangiaceae bacterium]